MTAGEFVDVLLLRAEQENRISPHKPLPKSLTYALADYDPAYMLRRKNAARLAHIFLRDVLNEADEDSMERLKKAEVLRDLYDCRICVQDIMQLYAKGIISAENLLAEEGGSLLIFGGNEEFHREEAEEWAMRLLFQKARSDGFVLKVSAQQKTEKKI